VEEQGVFDIRTFPVAFESVSPDARTGRAVLSGTNMVITWSCSRGP